MSLLNKLLAKAEGEMGLHYRNPKLPHACSIPGGLAIGSKIYIHGILPKDATNFSISLQRGADVEHADIYFHLSASFGNSPVVVRNARRSSSWGLEERDGKIPFSLSSPFLLLITTSLECFEVEVNGSPHYTFSSRDGLPISSITHLAIQGSLSIRAIHIPVENMPRNLRLSIPGKAKVGDMVFLRGAPPPGAQSFVLNVQNGPGKFDDVMFHFNPRLPEKKVVQNCRIDDVWGPEEIIKPSPFADSSPFHLVVASSSLGFETWLEGKELSRFNHRHELTNACTVFIEGDLCTEDLVIDSALCALPPEWDDGLNLASRNARLQTFCLELPFIAKISGGLEKGCLILLSGEVPKEPTRFHLNILYDPNDDSDIGFHYNARWDETDPCLVLNSREEEKWGHEVKIKDRLGLTPGLHFDVAILFTGEAFRVSANGQHQTDFPLRLDGTPPDYVTIDGNVIIHRLIVL